MCIAAPQGGWSMANAHQMLREKGSAVITVEPTATVLQAAERMNEHHIGSLVVTHDDERMVGIFTERDILRRVVAAGRDPATTPVGDVMTAAVACATPHTTLDEMKGVMREQHIRHLPVVDEAHHVLGMISIGDLNRTENGVQERTIKYLEQYMSVS
jgi:CBS domain-containing protein